MSAAPAAGRPNRGWQGLAPRTPTQGGAALPRHALPCPARAPAADCGQAEFTPPGLVSLSLLRAPVLGPPHMRLAPPARAHFIGDLSPAADPLRYLRAVRELFAWYLQHGAAAAAAAVAGPAAMAAAVAAGGLAQAAAAGAALPPLVVNTHGWVKGLGLDVLCELLAGFGGALSHFVSLCSPNPHKNLPEGAFWAPADAPPPAALVWALPALGGGGEAAQPALSGVSASSARTAATAASGGGGGGGGEDGGGRRGLAPVEARALQWSAWAAQCIAAMGGGSTAEAAAAAAAAVAPAGGGAAGGAACSAELADGLAGLVPWEVALDAVRIEVGVLGVLLPPLLLDSACCWILLC